MSVKLSAAYSRTPKQHDRDLNRCIPRITMKRDNESNVVITGFMATGKSTVGRLVAQRLGMEFIDTDDLIEKRWGKCIADIFSEEGEQSFRKKEARIAAALGARCGLVIATGGGMMLNPANIDAFNRQGRIYCLSASGDQILERINKDKDGVRPLAAVDDPMEQIQALMDARQMIYGQFIQIDTSDKTPEQVALELLRLHAKETKVTKN